MRIQTRHHASSTAAEVVDGVDLDGRRAVVTGGAGGVGREISRALALAGADVTVAVRRPGDAADVVADLVATTGNDRVRAAALDLADLASVRTFAEQWDDPLHLLVANAGVMALPELTRTADGHETQLAVNHLGHLALARGLHRALAAADGARIVAVSSSGHHVSPVDLDDLDFAHRPYDPWTAYGQSKTANVLFAVEATRRWAGEGIVANAVMPGGIMTDLQRHLPEEVRAEWSRIPTNKTPEQGAAISLVACVAPELEGVGGRYLEDGGDAPLLDDDAETDGVHGVRRWALDPETATRLWDASVALTESRVR